VTLTEFRLRLNDFSEYFIAVIADASEEVIDASTDQVVRRNAMEFRLRAVNTFLNALNKSDPVASLIDAWAFCLQIEEFLEPGGAGAELFGDQQSLLIDAARQITDEAERMVVAVTRSPADGPRATVQRWVDENPLVSAAMIRTSTTIVIADQLESQGDSAFAALGRLQAGVDDLVAQYQRYISVVPRMVRWGSQVILHETLYDELDLGDSLSTLNMMSEDFLALADLMEEMFEGMPNREELEAELQAALARLDSAIEAERARLLAEVDRQRGLVFDDVTAQREAIMRDLDAQIAAAEERLEKDLEDIFARVEALRDDTLRQSFDESERLINLIYLRVFVLLLVALAGGAGLILLNKWRGPFSPPPASTAATGEADREE
jgi:hypothetical protein